MRFESQLSRIYCQMFSTGLSSGDLDGSGTSVLFSGRFSFAVTCQPAWSTNSTAWAPGCTASAISWRCNSMASVLQKGRTRPVALPSAGQMRPKILADAGFVLELDFERLVGGGGDGRQEGWDFFLNAATAASSCS